MRKSLFLSAFMALATLFSCTKNSNNADSTTKNGIDARVDSVLKLMTIEEKIGQLNQYVGDGEVTGPVTLRNDYLQSIRDGKVGSMLNVNGTEYTRRIQKIAVEESRMKIPIIFGYDVIHGYKTIFPVPLGDAASWDLASIENGARVAAAESAAAGQHWTFAPMLDVARDPRWGRIMEGAGEDTYFGSLVGAARVRGFQGKDLADVKTIVACAKHFIGYGASMGGRDYNTTEIPDRVLREFYLPPFKAAIDAGAGTVMSSFNSLNGIPVSGDNNLINNILKKEWNYKGFVVSDWNSVGELIPHGLANDKFEASNLAFNAGVDMDMEGNAYVGELKNLLDKKKITLAQIDDAVKRVLRIKFMLGLFDDPYRYCDAEREKKEILSKENLEAARDAARKSFVLLRNEKNILPLAKTVKNIALIGTLADAAEDMMGTWNAQGKAENVITLKTELQNRLTATKINYVKGCPVDSADRSGFSAAIAAARASDVVIVAVGEKAMMSGEALSRMDISIPAVQQELVAELLKTGKPVVVVLFNGRPLTIPWLSQNAPAILEAWLPGTMAGPALVDVLFGDYNPAGKLPATFPYSVGQIPLFYNHLHTGRPRDEKNRYSSKYIDGPNTPVYPFGYGLSYTTFEYGKIKLNNASMAMNDSLQISIDLKNTGKYAGEEVVQLYIRDLVASVSRPVKELKGFQKIMLQAGESKTVQFTIKAEHLAFWRADMTFAAEAGNFKVFIGTDSQNVSEADFVLK